MAWNINGASREMESASEFQLDVMAEIMVGEIQTRTPVDKGQLKGGTRWRMIGKLARRVFNNVQHAMPQEFGSVPHTIVAKTKKALAFKGRDGKTVIVKSVQHPGNPPQPFFRPGAAASAKKIQRVLR